MAIKYKKLWKLLIDKEINKPEFRKKIDMSTTTLAKLVNNEYVSLEIIDRICYYLDCQPGDLMEYVPGDRVPKKREVKFSKKTKGTAPGSN